MKIINLLILLLAIPPAILSSVQLLDTTLPIVSPIYNSFVKTATDKVIQLTQPKVSASRAPASGGGPAADMSPTAQDEANPGQLRWAHLGVAAASILIALAMFLGLRRRAHA